MYRQQLMWLAVLGLAWGAGCERDKQQTEPTEPAKTAQPDPATEAKVKAILAKADKLDGHEDKVVHRCPTCALSMDGKAEYARDAMDYTLHFCTERCAQVFSKNLTQSILALNVPEPPSDATEAPVVTIDPADEELILPVLAAADKLDGKEDKIVMRCASCALSMNGKPEHTIDVLGYTMYFCGSGCVERFSKDVTSSVLSLSIPEASTPGA